MNELEFYTNLKVILAYYNNTNMPSNISLTLHEINKRLEELEQKEEVSNWNKLCLLIESTAKKYEATNKYTNITIDYDYAEITITNRLYKPDEF